jgi:hypothetical protein
VINKNLFNEKSIMSLRKEKNYNKRYNNKKEYISRRFDRFDSRVTNRRIWFMF